MPLSEEASTEKHVEVIEAVLVDENGDESALAEHLAGDDQEQPAS